MKGMKTGTKHSPVSKTMEYYKAVQGGNGGFDAQGHPTKVGGESCYMGGMQSNGDPTKHTSTGKAKTGGSVNKGSRTVSKKVSKTKKPGTM